jgi:hypothetical protein
MTERTAEERARLTIEFKRLRYEKGWTLKELSIAFQIPLGTVANWTSPKRIEYFKRRREALRAEAALARGQVNNEVEGGPKLLRHVKYLLSLLPDDTRSMTARAFGDPLPGRSALDARMR